MNPPIQADELDIEELERFEHSHVGQVYSKKILDLGLRHSKRCQDRGSTVEEIRASQGALEIIWAVLDLPKTMRAEIENRKARDNSGKK